MPDSHPRFSDQQQAGHVTIGFRAANQGSAGGGNLGLTIPAGVKAGDICLILYVINSGIATLNGLTTNGKTVPATVRALPFTDTALLLQFQAAPGDAGANLTFSNSAGAASVADIAAYFGAGLLTAGMSKPFTFPNSLNAASPVITPVVPGSWEVAMGAQVNGANPAYAPGTLRVNDGFGISSIYDSNGPVNSAGGGLWSNVALGDWEGFTVALPPAPQAGLQFTGMRFPPPGMFS